jgi:1-acyl-sn-glycerol-3-phosphate acyltransferase
MILYPTLLFFIFRGSIIAGTLLVLLITISVIPLKFKHWDTFMKCFIWDIWVEYFNFTYDDDATRGKLDPEKKFIFFEFPHAIFPMGQVLSTAVVDEVCPHKRICGTGADIIFKFPFMRHFMAWIGTRPASRKNYSKIYQDGHYAAVIPGGIAEMYLVSKSEEAIFFKKRRGTVKVAIQEGAHIVPAIFFGNSKIFDVVGNNANDWLAKLSRKLRASIVFFYGRHYLPVPYRHPIHMAIGEIVEVVQKAEPSEEEIDEVMNRVVKSIQECYEKKKPVWETRPLVIQ